MPKIDHTLDLEMPRAMHLNQMFDARLDEAGIRVRSLRTKANRLEELFVRLVKRGSKEAA
jgi:ABC-2 type transport system ATP-binding protein